MKKYLPFLIVVVFLSTLTPVFADSPQPLNWMYAATKCTSLPVSTIQSDYQAFVTQYGFDHNLPEGNTLQAMKVWVVAYPDTVNQYARQYGCPDFINSDGTALTVWQRIYQPTYLRANGRGAIP